MARRLRPELLTEEAWAPFGWLPVDDTDPNDGQGRLLFECADPHLNVISHSLEELRCEAHGLWCDELFRHASHTQALMALDGAAVVAVAPAEQPASELGGALRVFRLEPLRPIVLHRATWHWGPYPIEAGRVRLLNLQGRRYAEDNLRADLGAAGSSVLVEV